jgi:ubiquinone/menaquinone biosynthesis C-methylase UbiE
MPESCRRGAAMKKFWKGILLLLLFLFLTEITISCTQQGKDYTEGWEGRLNRIQPPVQIMDVMGLKPGMVIGDIGAGTGRFAVWFADRVGESGRVYANDISERSLRHLERRCQRHGFKNVTIVLGEVAETNIPSGVLDIAFMINVYHHLDKPVELIRSIIPTLKPDGMLVIVEHDPIKSGYRSESTAKDKMIRQAGQAGYELIKIEDFLPKDYIYFFRPKGTN